MHLSVSCIFSVCRSKIDPKPELFAVAKRRDGVALNLDTRAGFGALAMIRLEPGLGWWFPS